MTKDVKSEWNMECPWCHEDGSLFVTFTSEGLLLPDGMDTDMGNCDTIWDGNSPCRCANCDWSGKAGDCNIEVKP